jgi:hypothetical protein
VDGTQIERVFSRKNAQNAQKGNPFFEPFPSRRRLCEGGCASLRQSAIRNRMNKSAQKETKTTKEETPLLRCLRCLLFKIRNPQCRRTHDTLLKLLYLMIPTLKPGFIAPVFGLFEENSCNCLTMNILHKNGRLFNQAQSRSIKVNQGQ